MTRKILRLEEIAERANVPLATLRYYRYIGEGGPRTWKLGRRVVAYEDDVESWLEGLAAAAGSGIRAS